MTGLFSGGPFRTALIVACVPLGLAVLGVWVVYGVLENRLMRATEDRLQAEVQGFAALYDQRRIVSLREAIAYRADKGDPAGSIYVLLDRNGKMLAGNLADWPAGIDVPEAGNGPTQGDRVAVGAGGDHLVSTQGLRGGFPVLVGVSLNPVDQTLTRMLWVLCGFGLAMLMAGLCAAWLTARAARNRIAVMNADLSRIGGAGGVAARLGGLDGSSEQSALVGHINAMLDRISHLFDAHQRLGNVVAHEMRTPLSRIRTQLDRLDLDDVSRAGLDEEIRNTIRLFDSLLSIAQMDAEAGRSEGLVPVDLSAILRALQQLYDPVAEDALRHLVVEAGGDMMLLGDPDLLTQLFSNLIENGLKYTRPGDTISVTLTCSDQRIISRVADTGPGIQADLKADLFTPFARGANTQKTPGHGLGLSLVRAIALRHGARPRVAEVEKGFAIEIDWLHLSKHSGDRISESS